MKIRGEIGAALLCILLTGCSAPGQMAASSQATSSMSPVSVAASSNSSSQPVQRESSAGSSAAEQSSAADPEQQREDSMTLEEKVGQLFFLSFRWDTDGTRLLTYNSTVQKEIQTIHPGGIALFGENIYTVPQVRTLIQKMQKDCSVPPFVGIDQEGGTVQRIQHTNLIPAVDVPSMWRVGKTGNTALAQQVGAVLGSELTVFGFNLDFAPDCDVFSNPDNTVIGTRSFSSNAQRVAAFSVAASAGLRSQKILPVCKHFPGHGDTAEDTHEGYATVNKTKEQLYQTELVPFQAQIQAGAEMIMAAHISLPKITGSSIPASLSPQVLQELLRKELGFQGVIITDALNMGAVAKHYSSGEAAVRALKAGADMLLMPENPEEAYAAVLKAVRSGEIPESRIEASTKRIMALKEKYGILAGRALGDESLLGCTKHRQVIEQIP